MKIALAHNLRPVENPQGDEYAEFDSIDTIVAMRDALLKGADKVVLIEADENAYEKIKYEKPDLVFNFAEGIRGECREAQIPLFCELLGVRYTGSGPMTMAVALDKAMTKTILSYKKILNADFCVLTNENQTTELEFPLIVKPIAEGSSKGIYNDSLVYDKEQLKKQVKKILEEYKQPAIVETFLPGREFTIGLLGNGNPILLPIIEKDFSYLPKGANPIDSYEAKWIWDTPDNPLPILTHPTFDNGLENTLKTTALETYKALKCRDWARVDLRLDKNGQVNVLEINPIPGMMPKLEENSCLPKAAHEYGMSYEQLVNMPVYFALKRYGLDTSRYDFLKWK